MTIVGGGTADSLVREDGVVGYIAVGPLTLESGYRLPRARLAYETWGRLNADGSNAVLIEHALTGDSHVARGQSRDHAPEVERLAAEAGGWWDGLVGPGAAIDTDMRGAWGWRLAVRWCTARGVDQCRYQTSVGRPEGAG